MGGINPAYIAKQLGQASLAMMFKVYAKWINRADKGAEAAKANAAVGAQLSPNCPRKGKASDHRLSHGKLNQEEIRPVDGLLPRQKPRIRALERQASVGLRTPMKSSPLSGANSISKLLLRDRTPSRVRRYSDHRACDGSCLQILSSAERQDEFADTHR
jgi:hypothetical protein